jgi:hypothetical protein
MGELIPCLHATYGFIGCHRARQRKPVAERPGNVRRSRSMHTCTNQVHATKQSISISVRNPREFRSHLHTFIGRQDHGGYLISIGRPAESFSTTISTSNLSLSTLILHPFLNYCPGWLVSYIWPFILFKILKIIIYFITNKNWNMNYTFAYLNFF